MFLFLFYIFIDILLFLFTIIYISGFYFIYLSTVSLHVLKIE